jgi:ABC-type Fe3+-siderophore transport system permease subunit
MIGGIWAAGYYYLNIWWVNLLLLIVLLLALYGIFLGFVQVVILASSSSVKVSVAKLAIAVIQIAAFIAAVLQIMQILKAHLNARLNGF